MKKNLVKCLWCIIGMSIWSSANSQNKSPNIVEQDFYDFYNSLGNPDSNHGSSNTFNLSNNTEFYPEFDKKDIDTSIFTKEDIAFMQRQFDLRKNFKWPKGKIKGANIIDGDELENYWKNINTGWKRYYAKYKRGFATYSIPLFSVDKTKCLIAKGWHCGGLCGYGGKYNYIKINGKWEQQGSASIYVN